MWGAGYDVGRSIARCVPVDNPSFLLELQRRSKPSGAPVSASRVRVTCAQRRNDPLRKRRGSRGGGRAPGYLAGAVVLGAAGAAGETVEVVAGVVAGVAGVVVAGTGTVDVWGVPSVLSLFDRLV